jgi:hypothetical protein
MARAYLKPPQGISGVFKLAEPFTNAVSPNVVYRIAEVRSLVGVAASGDDPYEKYYKPAGVTEEKYLEDLANDVAILSLQSTSGKWVHVPNSYLQQMPAASGVPYALCIMGINLGAIPNDLDLTYFEGQIKDLARDLLGVSNADVQATVGSETTYIEQATAKVIEQARTNVMKNVVTDRAKYLASEEQRLAAVAKIAILEKYIKDNFIVRP